MGMAPRMAPWTTLGSGRSRTTRAAGAFPCFCSWWRIRQAPAEPRVSGRNRTQPRTEALRTLGRSPVTRPVTMSTSPKKEIGSRATRAGPAPAPATMPRPWKTKVALVAGPAMGSEPARMKAPGERRLHGFARPGQQCVALDHVADIFRLLGGIDHDRANGRRHDPQGRIGRGRAGEMAHDGAGIGDHLGPYG